MKYQYVLAGSIVLFVFLTFAFIITQEPPEPRIMYSEGDDGRAEPAQAQGPSPIMINNEKEVVLVYPEDDEVKDVTIGIHRGSFDPSKILVFPGTTVTWVNHDNRPHKVAESGRLFYSPQIDEGESFSYTFDEAGTYEFFDVVFYKTQRGTVTVSEESNALTGYAVHRGQEQTFSIAAVLVLIGVVAAFIISYPRDRHKEKVRIYNKYIRK